MPMSLIVFFPQFFDFQSPVLPQFFVLGGLFLLLDRMAVALYAGLGRVMSGLLAPVTLRPPNRGVGRFLMVSGLGLLLNSRSA
jgi:threonine/homoserine/homoserine lactone efflux protein